VPSGSTSDVRQVAVGWQRLPGWIDRYTERHPGSTVDVSAEAVSGTSPDGSSFRFEIPFEPLSDERLVGLRAHLERPWVIGIVLVRKGGFAVARLSGAEVVESKVGQRHVQSRSKAGGWSQQRFARRRDNQAKAAYDAASGYVHEILLPYVARLDLLVTGGDKAAVEAVFEEPALRPLLAITQRWLPGLPDPKRQVLDAAISQARSVEIAITDTTPR
jgi:hypothetical protein